MDDAIFTLFLLFALAVVGLNLIGLYAAIKAHSLANSVEGLRNELKRVRKRLQRLELLSADEQRAHEGELGPAAPVAASGRAAKPAATSQRSVDDRPAPAAPPEPSSPLAASVAADDPGAKPKMEPRPIEGPKVEAPTGAPAMDKARETSSDGKERAAASKAPPRSRVKAPGIGIEEQLGARLPVWLGSIALALAGTFLVKYAFDSGWFPPSVRIAMGVVFGLSLLGAGEYLRERVERIPAGLSAAGISVLYASFLSARHVFDPPLLTAAITFVLMAITTALAIFLSLRQGQIVALIGMVGGFLTPQLVGGGPDTGPVPVFGYLFLLQIGILSVSRKREWTLMGAIAPVAAIAWVLLWTLDPSRQADAPFLGFFVLATLATSVYAATSGDPDRAWRGQGLVSILQWLVAGSALLALSRLTLLRYSYWEWAYLGLLALGSVVMARLDRGSRPLPFVAAATIALLHLTWATGDAAPEGFGSLWVLALLGATFAMGSAWAMRGREEKAPWALLGSSVALVYPVIGHLGANELARGLAWEWIYLAVAAICLAAAGPVIQRRLTTFDSGGRPSRDEDETLSSLTLATAALVALAVPAGLSEMPVGFTLAWALEMWVVVLAAGILRLPGLRAFAWPLTLLVAVRLLGGYEVFDYPWERRPVFNRTVLLYSLPMLAFVGASWRARRDDDGLLGNLLGYLATAFGFVLIGLELRNVFQDSLLGGIVEFSEAASYGPAWLIFALLLLVAGKWIDLSPLPWLAPAGAVVGAIAVAFHLLLPSLVLSPWFTSAELSKVPILNPLLGAFALPALMAFALAVHQRDRNRISSRIFLVGAVAFAAVWLALQMRHLSGAGLIESPATLGEWGTLSGLWIAAGIGLIWLERRRFRPWLELRGSGIVLAMIGVVVGVFISGLVRNPAFQHIAVGERILFNQVLFGFGLPAVMSILAGRALTRWQGRPGFPAWPASAAGLWILFLFVTLEVRQAFRGNFLDDRPSGLAQVLGTSVKLATLENYTYSLAWVLLAVSLLVAGIASRGRPVRFASLAVMLLAVLKVFLYDTAQLGDLLRVFSFLGLGLSLLLLSYLYQRYVFVDGPITLGGGDRADAEVSTD